MKLRTIILSAVAFALAASFTACSKDKDDDDNNDEEQQSTQYLNVYQAWNIENKKLGSNIQNVYYIFDRTEMGTYVRYTEASAEADGLSADTAYFESSIPLTTQAVSSKDTAMVKGAMGTAEFTFHFSKNDDGTYTIILSSNVNVPDTLIVTPAEGVKRGYYKDVDDD